MVRNPRGLGAHFIQLGPWINWMKSTISCFPPEDFYPKCIRILTILSTGCLNGLEALKPTRDTAPMTPRTAGWRQGGLSWTNIGYTSRIWTHKLGTLFLFKRKMDSCCQDHEPNHPDKKRTQSRRDTGAPRYQGSMSPSYHGTMVSQCYQGTQNDMAPLY